MYGNSVYSKHVLGTQKSVSSIKIADLKEFHWRTFSPSNAVLCIAGDVSQQGAFQMARSVLGDIPSGSEFDYSGLEVSSPPEASELRVKREQSQTILEMGFLGPSVLDEDYIKLKPAVSVLSRRLFYKYVYEQPIAYRMWLWISPFAGPSAIRFETGVAREDFETAYTGIKSAVAEFIEGGFTEDEFELAKSNIVQSFILNHEDNMKRSAAMARYEAIGLGFDYLKKYTELIQAVTMDAALETAREYFKVGSEVVVITGKFEE
jgi:zinc protease